MSKSIFLSLLFVFALLSNAEAQKSFDTEAFTEIGLSRSGNVYVKKGDQYHVEITGDEDDVEETEVVVRGERLVIKSKKSGWSWFEFSGKVDVYVTVPRLEGLSVSSSGHIEVQDTFEADQMEYSVSGSGSIEMDVNAEDIRASISGSGRIILSGTANSFKSSISGSGSVRAAELVVNSVDARISGSGSCRIHANKSIEASISGSGSIYYKGDATQIDTRTSGSGRVKRM